MTNPVTELTSSTRPAVRTALYVLDTSALVAFPEVLDTWSDGLLVIPLSVVEELDGLKRRQDDVGWAARSVLRRLESLRGQGDLREPVSIPGGGAVRVEPNGLHLSALAEHGLDANKTDNRILAAALGQGACTLVSNDAALRIKAAQLGLAAIELSAPSRSHDVGWEDVEVPGALIDELYDTKHAEELPDALAALEVNRFGVLHAGRQSALVRRTGTGVQLLRSREPWDLKPRSKEQRFALDLLMDPEVEVIALEGAAGTGKTILALAAGLEQVVEQRRYRKLRIFRPIVPVDRSELGFLPGDVDEKLHPWMAAVTDALEALAGDDEDGARNVLDELVERGQLTLEAVTFLRGRTLASSFILVDEAQNLSPAALKTILTRAGNGTKVVLTGDCSQIDQPYLSPDSNALAVLRDRFAGHEGFGWLRLESCERSPVAELAAKLL